MKSYLLDTCAVIWIVQNEPLNEPASSELRSGTASRFYVSPATAWEIALLVVNRRLALASNPLNWYERFVDWPKVTEVNLTADVLINSTTLPEITFKDPVDRMLIATARKFAYTIVTRDQKILEYGKLGHVCVLAC